MKKRLPTLVLILCLLLVQLPLPVLAAEPVASALQSEALQSEASLEQEDHGEAQARYRSAEDGEWLAGSLADAVSNVYEGGRVEVLEDVRLEAPLSLRKAMTLTSADPSAPRVIRYTTDARADFGVTVYAEVTFEHLVLDGGREEGLTTRAELVGVQRGATLTLGAGAVIQNNDNVDTSEAAGGLRVIGSHVVMEEGSLIRSCRGVLGGGAAVTSNGVLELRGGVIEHCQAFVGGGVYLPQGGGDVKLYAGAIRGNEARKELEGMSYHFNAPKGCGGGIAVNQGRVYLLGDAALSGNYAASGGGGIYVNNGLLQLASGAITGNEAGGYGGGVYASPDTYIAVGGVPNVTGNVGGHRDEGCFDNLYLDGVEDDFPAYSTRPMTVGAALGEQAAIGVARWTRPDQDHPYRVVAVPNAGKYTITAGDLDKFHSDDPAYITLLHEGTIVLAAADVRFDIQGHGTAPKGQHLAEDRKAGEPETPVELGYDFGGWYQEAACETPWDFEHDMVLETREEPLTLYAKWTPTPYAITYQLDGGEKGDAAPDSYPEGYTIESETITLAVPTKEGHTFLGWTQEEGEAPTTEAAIPHGSTGDRVFTAQWTRNTYPVTFDAQGHGTAPEAQTVDWNGKVAQPAPPSASGYTFGGWYKEAECQTAWSFDGDVVTEAVTLYAKWTRRPSRPKPTEEQEIRDTPVPAVPYPELEREEHFAYIVGYPDGSVRPEGYITRAEAITVFFRLMTDSAREEYRAENAPFPDVGVDKWYHNAAATAARAGLVNGLPGGAFGGERRITRAEFAVLAARFLGDEEAPDSGFADLTGHWARAGVDRAVAAGWLKGCDDGLFHPDELITRAQVMALVNRMLGRVPAAGGMLPDMRRWPDNETDAWYYGDVQEATNGHSYDRSGPDGPESWTALTENRDWTALEG